MRALSKTLLHGIVTCVTLAMTLHILWWLGSSAEAGLGKLLQLALPERFYVPGMGLGVGLLLVFVIGILTQAFFVRKLIALAERRVRRIPVLATLYGSLKDLMGPLTRESAADLTGNEQDLDRSAVYLPMSYAVGGFMVLAPRTAVARLAMSAEDALRTARTAGVSTEGRPSDVAAPGFGAPSLAAAGS